MRVIILIAAISLLGLALISCDSDDLVGPDDVFFGMAAFPHGDGDYWVYARTDNNTGAVDTITISILETMLLDCDGPDCALAEQLWKLRSESLVDSQATTVDSSSLHLCGFMSGTRIRFPLEVGKSWSDMILVDDTTNITEMVTVTVPAGSIPFCFHLDRRVTYLDTWERIHLWVAPTIGIVKMTWVTGGMGSDSDQTWELIEYGNIPVNNFTLDRFPMNTGSWWRYLVEDYYWQTVDTLTIRCIDTDFVADFQIWMHSDGAGSELRYSTATANKIVFYLQGNIENTYKSLLFPLRLGRAWVTEPGLDTNEVSETGDYRLPTGELSIYCMVWTSRLCGELCTNSIRTYYVANLGMTYRMEVHVVYDTVSQESVTYKDERITLIDYHIEP